MRLLDRAAVMIGATGLLCLAVAAAKLWLS
jgi:hypothetical protein